MSPGWLQDSFASWDKTKIFYRFYPCPKARHTVVMLHGFGEHSGRYEKFPERMAGLQVQLAIMDFRGMGNSGGAKGDAKSFEDYLKDVDAFIMHLQSKHSVTKKFILLGHSFGGLVAVFWAMRHPEGIKTLILSAPFLALRNMDLLQVVNRLVKWVRPGHVYRNPVYPAVLSHDPDEIAWYRQDKLIVRAISCRLTEEIMRRSRMLRDLASVSFPFPVCVLAAGKERIVDPKAINRFFERLAASRKEFFRFDGFYHEIFNEAGQEKAFNVLKTIIEDCV